MWKKLQDVLALLVSVTFKVQTSGICITILSSWRFEVHISWTLAGCCWAEPSRAGLDQSKTVLSTKIGPPLWWCCVPVGVSLFSRSSRGLQRGFGTVACTSLASWSCLGSEIQCESVVKVLSVGGLQVGWSRRHGIVLSLDIKKNFAKAMKIQMKHVLKGNVRIRREKKKIFQRGTDYAQLFHSCLWYCTISNGI